MKENIVYQPFPLGNDPQHEGRCLAWKKALLCIDMQYLNCQEGSGVFEDHKKTGISEDAIKYYLDQVDTRVLPNTARLQQAFRELQQEVVHVRIQSLTADGRDRSLEHKELGLHAAPGSKEAEFMSEVAPMGDEIIINKTASGVFISTNIEYVLRNLCISEIYITGVYTNECISSAVRSASDLGFRVYLVADATAAITHELHEATLLTTKDRYARVQTTDEILYRLNRKQEQDA